MLFLTILFIIALLFRKPKSKYWNGPAPTLPEKQYNWQWMVDHFQQFPNSYLQTFYPDLHRVAMATKRYKELEFLKEKGLIDEIDYNIELDKVLPLIDIRADVQV